MARSDKCLLLKSNLFFQILSPTVLCLDSLTENASLCWLGLCLVVSCSWCWCEVCGVYVCEREIEARLASLAFVLGFLLAFDGSRFFARSRPRDRRR